MSNFATSSPIIIWMSLKLYLVSFEFRTGGDYASLKEQMRTLQA